MKRGRVRCPIKRGGKTNGRTSDTEGELSDLVLTESLVRLEYSEDGVLKMVERKLYKIEILALLPVRS